jgi:predicted PurR-regulated permease PerM
MEPEKLQLRQREMQSDPLEKTREESIVCIPESPEAKPDISHLSEFLDRTRTVLPLAVIGIFCLGFVAFLYFARPFALPIMLALVLNFLLKPVVLALSRLRVPEPFGAALVMATVSVVIWVGVSQFSKPLVLWIDRAPESLRSIKQKLHDFTRPAERLTKAAETVQDITTSTPGATTKVEVHTSPLKDNLVSYAKSFLVIGLETGVLLYFLLAAGDLFMQKLVSILPTLRDKKMAVEISNEVQQNISRFLFTVTVINIFLGVAVGLAMWMLGMANPVLWGAVAGLLNFIPYFGPLCGTIILAMAGLLTFESVGQALLPPLCYISLHALESNFITPLILGRRLTLNPVVIFISLIFWTWLWGIPGVLLSIPTLMMIKILCEHFKPLSPIGEFLSGDKAAETRHVSS